MKYYKYLLAVFLSTIALSGAAYAKQKVLLIGVDGVQYEKLKSLHLYSFQQFKMQKAFAGGVAKDNSEQPTLSGPGWSTILTGVWANKHHITSNSSGLANPEFPSVFKYLRQYDPSIRMASIVDWPNINTAFFKNDVKLVDVVKSNINDLRVTWSAIREINKGTDFIFTQLDGSDEVGHKYGFGLIYNASLRFMSYEVGWMMDAVRAEHNATGDNWLVLVVTDHGRKAPEGRSHGGQTLSEKTAFIASNLPLNKEFSQYITPSNKDFNGLYGYPSQASVTPTILSFMGETLKPEWKMDGPSLYGPVGIRKLFQVKPGVFSWVSNNPSPVSIYKNGKLVGSVPANSQTWTDPNPSSQGVSDYVFSLNKNPVAYRVNNKKIPGNIAAYGATGTGTPVFHRS